MVSHLRICFDSPARPPQTSTMEVQKMDRKIIIMDAVTSIDIEEKSVFVLLLEGLKNGRAAPLISE